MNRVLVLGAGGMLGHSLFQYFSKQPNCVTAGTVRNKSGLAAHYNEEALTRIYDGVNADCFDSVVDVFARFRPTIAINCIGIIKQLPIAKDPLVCININARFPHKLVRFAAAAGVRIIHVSTDCVFNGEKGGYMESDPPTADDIYGISKYLGELVNYPNAVTLRTSIIGHEWNKALSLIDWFLNQKGTVNGYSRVLYSGFPTIELAEIIDKHVIPRTELCGLYHVSSDPISKYDLLKLVAKQYGKDTEIVPTDKVVSDRSMNSERFRKVTGYVPPSWEELVRKMYTEMKNNTK